MCSRDECQAIVVVESLRDILPKCVTSTSGRDPPPTAIIGVTPQQITHGAFVRHLLNTIKRSDVVEGIDTGRQTTMKAEDLVLNQGGKRKVVKEVGEELPDIGIAVLAQALVIEAIDLRNLTALVVAAKDRDALRVADLEGYE